MQRRERLHGLKWEQREWGTLLLALMISFGAAVLGAAINFNERLSLFFRPHAAQPTVQFLINFLVVWLAVLLVVSYVRWRRVATRNQELEDIIASISPDVLLVVDAGRNILMANTSMPRMFGYGRDEVLGQKTDLLYFDRRRSPEVKHEIYDILEREGFHIGLATGRKKDGATFPLEIITGVLRRHGGSVLLLRDISERQRAQDLVLEREEQLRQAQKMEALGLLAGGVAHDFNNLLTSIIGFANLALESLPAGHPVRPDIEEVIHGGERAVKLTSQLLALARKQILQMRRLDLNAVVSGMAQLLQRTLGEDIGLVMVLGEDLAAVESDPGGLEQVILNLAVNARDAMPMGGKLIILTERVRLDESYCASHVGVQPGEYVMLSVRDTGSGITREVREHLFEPFFTTKERGRGTGLGLSTAYGIIKQCRGHIDVESTPGIGSEFRVYLPGTELPAEAVSARVKTVATGGAETILVVEDEYAVRAFAVRILRGLGYHVLEAGNAGDALAICERHKERIHLIMTDLVMPQVSGRGLVEHVSQIRHDFAVLYTTGFSQDAIDHHGLAHQHEAILLKPYTRESLALRIRQILEAP
jgi:two-component system, cell cycle sensor histidine kinase and response regulator CckA